MQAITEIIEEIPEIVAPIVEKIPEIVAVLEEIPEVVEQFEKTCLFLKCFGK